MIFVPLGSRLSSTLKMQIQNLRRVLLWEIFSYDPKLFFVLEFLSTELRNIINSDVSYLHYFFEENFGRTQVRDKTMERARALLYECFNKDGLYLAAIADPAIMWYDPVNKEEKLYQNIWPDHIYHSKFGMECGFNMCFIPRIAYLSADSKKMWISEVD